MRPAAVAATVLVLCTGGGANAAPNESILQTSQSVNLFAADGGRVAIPSTTRDGRPCDAARAISVDSRRAVDLVSPRAVCEDDWPIWGDAEIAVAGDRVVWITYGASNDSAMHALDHTRPLDAGTDRRDRRRGDYLRGHVDRRVGLLAGDGATMAFATWTLDPGGRIIRGERVWLIGPTGAPLLLARAPGLRAVAVEHGTVAILRDGGVVMIIDTRRRTRRTVRLSGLATPLQARRDFDLGLSAGRLVVLATRSLDVFDSADGRLIRSWPLPALTLSQRGLLDVQGDWVSYLVRTSIRLHRISDGASGAVPDKLISQRGCAGDAWAQVEKVGLIYSSSRSSRAGCRTSRIGRLRFEQLASFVRGG